MILLIIFFVGISIYWFIPSIWYRVFSTKTLRHTKEGTIGITFDDGPSTNATEDVLTILKEHNTKITFFVLGDDVKKHPDLVQKELADGHEVGLHGMSHKCQWFMRPSKTFEDVTASKEALISVGGNPLFFRPPWGLYNLFTVIACEKEGLRCVHWTKHTYDWRSKVTKEQQIESVQKNMKSGDILLLHDGRGDKGAPERTVKALPEIIETLHKKNLVPTKL